jgi:L-ascorbate metabolism protein UlaG (beta-lactamase superfamily)
VAVACALMAALTACARPRPKACTTLTAEPADAADTVQVSFLGVGGVIVRWQGQALMTAPLYSNPTMGELALSEIHVDRQRVDGLMREGHHDLDTVRAILSGHSHYDHLMDVPHVALHRARNAEIIGNDAMVKLLAPIEKQLEPRALVSLEGAPGEAHLVPGTRIRVRAVPSLHSPQMGPRLESKAAPLLALLFPPLPDVSLWRGEDEQRAGRLPVRVGEWTGGTALAFVIELLQPAGDEVAFRIYYQDSPTRPFHGYPPRSSHALGYDLAILCVGGSTEYKDFPGDIVAHLAPRYVMGVHWEDFFNPRELRPPAEDGTLPERVGEAIDYAPGVDEKRFLERVRAAQPPRGQAIVPCPDQTTVFRRTAGGWDIDDPAWSRPKP